MKRKLALISLISILLVGTQAYSQIIHERSFYDDETSLERAQSEFFETGAVPSSNLNSEIIEDTPDYSSIFTGSNSVDGKELKAMPFFKRCRIKLQNRHRIKEHDEMLKRNEALKEIFKPITKTMGRKTAAELLADIPEEDLVKLLEAYRKKKKKS